VIEAIVSAVEQRLNQHSAQVQQKIAGLESSVAANAQAAASRQIEQETGALRTQVVSMQREFAQSVAAIVAEQVAVQVAERTRAMEASIQARIESAVAPLRQEIQELRRRVAATDNTMGEFVAAISETVRQASERSTGTEPQGPRTPEFPRSGEPVPIRAHQTPQHLDLRVLRNRLRDAGLPARESHPGYMPSPAAPQRRTPGALSRFRAAS
jgi:hypothetical protein